MTPPLPRLTVNIGIVGHRRITPASAPALVGQVEAFLQTVKQQVADLVEAEYELIGKLYACNAETGKVEPRFVLLSALAAGADSIVARAALDMGYELHVPLPMAQEEYRKDFSEKDKVVFDGLLSNAHRIFEIEDANPERGHSYADASRVVLNQSDVLLALWDKKDTEYVAGTAATMESAIRQHIPVVHVHADENSSNESVSIIIDSLRLKNWEENLRKHLNSLLLPVEARSKQVEDLKFTRASAAQKEIPSEYWHWAGMRIPNLFIRTEERFKALVRWRLPKDGGEGGVPGTREPIEPRTREPIEKRDLFTTRLGKEPEVRGERPQPLCPACMAEWAERFNWFDKLANAYSCRYRGGLVLRYFAPVLATVFLTFAIVWYKEFDGLHKGFVPACFLMQMLFLAVPIALHYVDKRRMWHRRFFSYRVVAEQLRQAKVVGPLGFLMVRSKESTYKTDPQRWTAWHFRALMRDTGLPHARVDHEYLKNWLLWARDKFIVEQLNYHDERWRREGNMCRRLILLGQWMFGLGVACALFRVIWALCDKGSLGENMFSSGATIIPAFAVFFAGFCAYACYAKDEQVSRTCCETMKRLCREMDAFLQAEDYPVTLEDGADIQKEQLHFSRAYAIAERVHDCCKSELLGWEDLVSTKRINQQ